MDLAVTDAKLSEDIGFMEGEFNGNGIVVSEYIPS